MGTIPGQMDSLSKFFSKMVTIGGGIMGGAFMTIAASSSNSGTWQGLGVAALGTAAVGALGWFTSHRKVKKAYLHRLEQRMIAVTKAKHGRVTDVELAAETRYSLEQCREFLTRMTESGSAERHIGKEGTVVYLFPGFLSEEEKRSARSVESWLPSASRETEEGEESPSSSSRSLEIQ